MAVLHKKVEVLRQSVEAMDARFQELHSDMLHPIVRHNVGNLLEGGR